SARNLSASCRNRNGLWLLWAKCARQLQARFRVTLPRWTNGICVAFGEQRSRRVTCGWLTGYHRAHALRRTTRNFGQDACAIDLARASRRKQRSGDIRIGQFAKRQGIRAREKRIVRVSIRLRFQYSERVARTEGSLNRMQTSRERLLEFLFPAETDNWLAVLRVGFGFQVVFYSLSLRNDWNYLLSGTASGLVTRNLAEALLSLESRFVPRLEWLVALGAHVGLHDETVVRV